MKKILITGTTGFIFSNFIRKAFSEKLPYQFVGVDAVLASYNRQNIFTHPNYKFYMGDIANNQFMDNVFALEKPDIVINGAAESFVDDSIKSAQPFVHSNIMGCQVMIDLSLKYNVERFIQISTDEVYGQLQPGDSSWTEQVTPRPRNPYSASKYAAEILVYAASQTHGLQFNITRCCNNYYSHQPPRNLVPRIITSIMKKVSMPIHGKGNQIREWIAAPDHCSAIMTVIEKAPTNEIYNIGSGIEFTNMEMVKNIGKILGVPNPKTHTIPDRAGHDFRYSVNCDKIKKLGWNPEIDFDTGIKKTVDWYLENHTFYDF